MWNENLYDFKGIQSIKRCDIRSAVANKKKIRENFNVNRYFNEQSFEGYIADKYLKENPIDIDDEPISEDEDYLLSEHYEKMNFQCPTLICSGYIDYNRDNVYYCTNKNCLLRVELGYFMDRGEFIQLLKGKFLDHYNYSCEMSPLVVVVQGKIILWCQACGFSQ